MDNALLKSHPSDDTASSDSKTAEYVSSDHGVNSSDDESTPKH